MTSPLALIDGWARPRAAAVLVGGVVVDSRGDASTTVPWASVTKLATALATLIAVARGHLSLDDPAGPPGSTVRHLLAHASGLDVSGATVRAPPGTRRIYSNAGYELLGTTVAAAVGLPFATWLGSEVLAPLGMTATRLDGSPASGLVGPLPDLVALAAELQLPRLLPPPLHEAMHTVAWPGLAGVLPGLGWQAANDWGLGPEIRGAKAPHWTGRLADPSTFGHFGAGGSFVWVDPAAGVALACTTDRPFGPWARTAWPEVSDAVIGSL